MMKIPPPSVRIVCQLVNCLFHSEFQPKWPFSFNIVCHYTTQLSLAANVQTAIGYDYEIYENQRKILHFIVDVPGRCEEQGGGCVGVEQSEEGEQHREGHQLGRGEWGPVQGAPPAVRHTQLLKTR